MHHMHCKQAPSCTPRAQDLDTRVTRQESGATKATGLSSPPGHRASQEMDPWHHESGMPRVSNTEGPLDRRGQGPPRGWREPKKQAATPQKGEIPEAAGRRGVQSSKIRGRSPQSGNREEANRPEVPKDDTKRDQNRPPPEGKRQETLKTKRNKRRTRTELAEEAARESGLAPEDPGKILEWKPPEQGCTAPPDGEKGGKPSGGGSPKRREPQNTRIALARQSTPCASLLTFLFAEK